MKQNLRERRKLLPWYAWGISVIAIVLTLIVFAGLFISLFEGSLFKNHVSGFNYFGYHYLGTIWNAQYIALNVLHIYVGICSVLLCLGLRFSLMLSLIGYLIIFIMGILVFFKSGFSDFRLLTAFAFLMLLGLFNIKGKWYAVNSSST